MGPNEFWNGLNNSWKQAVDNTCFFWNLVKEWVSNLLEVGTRLSKTERKISKFIDSVNLTEKNLDILKQKWENIVSTAETNSPPQAINIIKTLESTQKWFSNLEKQLLDNLAVENIKKISSELSFEAQVLVDILIRNLYERTADVWFLATDDDICKFLTWDKNQDSREKIEKRLNEYRDKYTVYDEIIILDTDWNVVANLNKNNEIIETKSTLLQKTIENDADYLESFEKTDLINFTYKTPLLYSKKIINPETWENLWALFLSFRFDDEMKRIFEKLTKKDDIKVKILIDDNWFVLASSDETEIPTWIKIQTLENNEDFWIIRFAWRDYLASTKETNWYQWYNWLWWKGQTMISIDSAFRELENNVLENIDPEILSWVLKQSWIFCKDLGDIANQAEIIEKELKRIIWNWQIISSPTKDEIIDSNEINNLDITNENKEVIFKIVEKFRDSVYNIHNEIFAKFKSILEKVSLTWETTSKTFKTSIDNLFETIISSNLSEVENASKLAIDIMDRNLYERANDCRWWALNSDIRAILSKEKLEEFDFAKINEILEYINSLYTVYSRIFVYDKKWIVLNSSVLDKTDRSNIVWKTIEADSQILNEVIKLNSSQDYCVTPFVNTSFYSWLPTYIYHASIKDIKDESRIVWWIWVVFDSWPEFWAMLKSSLPDIKWSFWLFVDKNAKVISSTTPNYLIWWKLDIDKKYFLLEEWKSKSDIILLNWNYYLMWITSSSWYREYKTTWDYKNDILAFVFSPIWKEVKIEKKREKEKIIHLKHITNETLEIATFYVNWKIYWIESTSVIESVNAINISNVPWAIDILWAINYKHNWKDKTVYIIDVNKVLQPQEKIEIDFKNKQIVILNIKWEFIWIVADDLEWVNLYDKNELKATSDTWLKSKTWYVKYFTNTWDWSDVPLLPILDWDIVYEIIKNDL